MNFRELMIGDYVLNLSNKKPDSVFMIREHYVLLDESGITHIASIAPILLTAQILVLSGFEKKTLSLWMQKHRYVYHFDKSFLLYSDYDRVFFTEICGVIYYIHYVHELQHILSFCHIDRDIIVNSENIY